ncbi:hypothetical protein B0T24DRAFT_239067 [Lasiosphaeria ovina]|uniref:Only prolin and serin are matching in the corresponding protein n=1 Tax=Lasiosphaeria ovina TaxID=92902 RepID=A0AAE0KIN1_9PEZI|nr:hypothetical protein B0T24DRAFT_239067 [Lasiosphaeria ovina]
MSPGLKPLILPQLVEERKKQELYMELHQELQQIHDSEDACMSSQIANSSASDIASLSPITPTFPRSSFPRYPGSVSSLDMAASSTSDSPASPSQPTNAAKNTKSQLPDVQEDPLEREDEGVPLSVFGLYSCLCDEPCDHNDLVQSTSMYPYMGSELYCDLGFLSDSDFNGSPRQKKRRHGSDAGFSGWGTRLGSRLGNLPRWRSTSRRNQFTFSPASDPSLDQRPSFSRAASSRSSSISVPTHGPLDRSAEAPLPATPALSFYESSESVVLPSPLEMAQATVGKSLERDRSMATTPLLPPLLTDTSSGHAPAHSLQASPLQSPTIAPSPVQELQSPLSYPTQPYPTPPLSAKASISSFRRGTVSSTFSDVPSPIPYLLDHHDAWSDRLGHANFTIEPKPYVPETADLAILQAFRADWDQARTNYTKHLARTAEHYSCTSKTYLLTEAKWTEIEQEWRRAEDDLIHRLDPNGNGEALTTLRLRRAAEEMLPAAIPRMLSDEGKFPERGDEDIVGPMARDAVMARDSHDEKKNSASGWLKNLAEKVGFRK